jgi:hypothetical protein
LSFYEKVRKEYSLEFIEQQRDAYHDYLIMEKKRGFNRAVMAAERWLNPANEYYLTDWKLTYQRRKTSKRSDGAHMEITVPKEIRPLFEKYRGDERLFNFHKRYANADIFSSNINKGLRSINPKLTTYTFRHSWATIARNDCGVLMEDVGFCLNHVSAHKVTDGYVVKDYSKVDVINQMVIKKVSELHNPDTFEQHQI